MIQLHFFKTVIGRDGRGYLFLEFARGCEGGMLVTRVHRSQQGMVLAKEDGVGVNVLFEFHYVLDVLSLAGVFK